MSKVRIWIASELEKVLALPEIKAGITLKPVRDVVYDYLQNAQVNDVIVLPFFSSFLQLVTKVRQRGKEGPIVFITSDSKHPNATDEMLENGVLLLRHGHVTVADLTGVINFMVLTENSKKYFYDRLVALEKLQDRDIEELSEVEEEAGEEPSAQEKTFEFGGDEIVPVLQQLLSNERRILFSFNYMQRS